MTTKNHNTPNKKAQTNDLARDVFVAKMNEIGAEIVYTPGKKGENYIVRHRGRNLKVRVRGTKEIGMAVYLIRASRTWFDNEYAPDVFYIVSGPRYYSKKQYVIPVNDARNSADVQNSGNDTVSYILSYDNVKNLHNEKIFGE